MNFNSKEQSVSFFRFFDIAKYNESGTSDASLGYNCLGLVNVMAKSLHTFVFFFF